MQYLLSISIYIFIFSFFGFSQDSKKTTAKYFSDFDLEIYSPAFFKKKGFTKYKEMVSFLDTLEIKYPKKVSVKFIGESQNGLKIPMVFLGNASSEFKVCFMGGLHGNEPASTEGMLFLINNLIKEDSLKYLVDNLNIAIIPMANIDGYQKQNRYASNGQDLNRDQTKFSNPESIFIKKAINKFNPDLMVDFHEYKPYRVDFVNFGEYGTTSMFDCMFLYSGNLNTSELIKETIEDKYIPNVSDKLDYYGLTHHNYISSKHKNNKVYFNLGSVSPRSSATSYALSNTISMLMEVRGVGLNRTSFKRRVFTTYLLANSFLKTSADNTSEIKRVIEKSCLFPKDIVIKYKKEKSIYKLNMIDVYSNEIVPVDIVMYNNLKCDTVLKRKRPKYYIIDSSLDIVIDKLEILGLDIDTLKYDELLNVESYKIISEKKSPILFQGFYPNIVKTSIISEEKLFKKGTFVIPMDQRRSNIAVETLEPEMLSGFLRFNVIKPNDISKIHRYLLTKEL